MNRLFPTPNFIKAVRRGNMYYCGNPKCTDYRTEPYSLRKAAESCCNWTPEQLLKFHEPLANGAQYKATGTNIGRLYQRIKSWPKGQSVMDRIQTIQAYQLLAIANDHWPWAEAMDGRLDQAIGLLGGAKAKV